VFIDPCDAAADIEADAMGCFASYATPMYVFLLLAHPDLQDPYLTYCERCELLLFPTPPPSAPKCAKQVMEPVEKSIERAC